MSIISNPVNLQREAKITFVSLGCSKNLVDTEVMMGLLKDDSFSLVEHPEDADLIIINTCGFIEDAKKESIEAILECSKLKEKGKKVIVAGCLAERYRDELKTEMPEIDLFIGVKEFEDIAFFCKKLLGYTAHKKTSYDVLPRVITTGKASAYIKISEGCNNRCSYCAIPSIRGPLHSKPLESVLKEAESLAQSGILEVNLLAQDITNYGKDIKTSLPELLNEMAKISSLRWIRILYANPEGITDQIIETIASHSNICPYIDMPIQHSHPDILVSMNRKPVDLRALVEKLRKNIPKLTLRTTLLVGCPGEEEKHFDHLVEFIKWAEFERLGVFEYSKEDNTVMALTEESVSDNIKHERKEILMELQADISLKKNISLVGSIQDVLIEETESEYLEGRTMFHAPEVDGGVILDVESVTDECLLSLLPGKIVPVKITKGDIYDLVGTPICK